MKRPRPLVEKVALVIYDDQYGWGKDEFDDTKNVPATGASNAVKLARRILRLVAREKKR